MRIPNIDPDPGLIECGSETLRQCIQAKWVKKSEKRETNNSINKNACSFLNTEVLLHTGTATLIDYQRFFVQFFLYTVATRKWVVY
jgi:hypothetical protein